MVSAQAQTVPTALRGQLVRRWAALGDSFTAGHPGAGSTWPDVLAASLRAAGHPVAHRSFAVAGVTSRTVLDSQLAAAVAFAPDLISLVCGANDVVGTVRPDLATFEANFRTLLGGLRDGLPGASLVTATYPDVTRFLGLRPRSKERVARGIGDLNELIRTAARETGAALVELADRPDEGERSCFAADGLHPSAEGHRRTAHAFADALSGQLGIEMASKEER